MRDVIRAVFKTGSGSGASMLLSAVSSKIMAIVSGPFGIGLYSLTQQLVQTVSSTGVVGGGRVVLTQGIASRNGRDRDDYIVTAFWILFIGAIISSLSLIALAPLIAPLVFNADDAGTIGLVRWTALPVALAVFLVYLNGVLNGFLAIGRLAIIQVAGAGMSAVVSYPISTMVNAGYHVAFVAMITLSISTQIVIGFSKAYRKGYLHPIAARGFRFRMRRDVARSFFAMAGTMMITGIVASVSLLFIRALIVQFGDIADAGIFNVAWIICMVYPMVILNSFNTYYLPMLSQTDGGRERSLLMSNVFRLTTTLIVPVLLLAIMMKPLIIDILYSEEFYPALAILRWMFIGVFLRAAALVFATPMLSFADMKTHFWTYNLWYAGFVGFAVFGIVHLQNLEMIGVGFVVVCGAYLAYSVHYANSRHGFRVGSRPIGMWVVGLALVVSSSILTWGDTSVDWLITSVYLVVGALYLILSMSRREREMVRGFLIQRLAGFR